MGFIGGNFGCKGIALVAVLRIGCRFRVEAGRPVRGATSSESWEEEAG